MGGGGGGGVVTVLATTVEKSFAFRFQQDVCSNVDVVQER